MSCKHLAFNTVRYIEASQCGFSISVSLMTLDVQHLVTGSFSIHRSSVVECPFQSLARVIILVFFYFELQVFFTSQVTSPSSDVLHVFPIFTMSSKDRHLKKFIW
jgi:hypothetical protein